MIHFQISDWNIFTNKCTFVLKISESMLCKNSFSNVSCPCYVFISLISVNNNRSCLTDNLLVQFRFARNHAWTAREFTYRPRALSWSVCQESRDVDVMSYRHVYEWSAIKQRRTWTKLNSMPMCTREKRKKKYLCLWSCVMFEILEKFLGFHCT